MSYCRFTNTLQDLRECLEHITDDLSEEEHTAREKLINVCEEITDEKENIPELQEED